MGNGVKLSDEQRLDWLRLIRSDNVGPRTFRNLVNHFGDRRCGCARTVLLELEIAGRLERHGGGLVSLL